MHLWPPRDDRRKPAPGFFIDVDGMRIHVESRGDEGPALLLLHGYLGTTATWRRSMPLLSQSMRVVAVDLPGAGYSDRPLGAPYTLDWFANLLPRIIERLGLSRPYVAGLSWGGAVALIAAARFPSLMRGLVLVSPLLQGDRAPPGLRIARRLPGVMRVFFSSGVGRAVVPTLVRRAGFTAGDRRARLRSNRLLAHLDAPGGWEAATRTGVTANDGAPGPGVVNKVEVPALVVWGETDPMHGSEVGARLVADLGGPASLLVLPASHNCHDEKAGAFAAAVWRFVQQQRRSPVSPTEDAFSVM